MAKLEIRLFGPHEVIVDGVPAEGFDSNKVRALLAFLAMEAAQPHRRQKLAGLLWSDSPESAARTNLRRALSNLRQVIGDRDANPPYLLISRQTIQFNEASDAWVDVAHFTALHRGQSGSPANVGELDIAFKIARGPFLEGFSMPDSPLFEEWQRLTEAALQQQLMRTLHLLTNHYESEGQLETALRLARRQVALEPYQEEAHQQVMRLLLHSGRRGEALAQFEMLKETLAKELDVLPSAASVALYERLKSGEATPPLSGGWQQAVHGYELKELLGSGHFGAVYRAHQQAVDRDVAVKIILPRFADDPDFIRRFDSEAQLVARLEHPHIVPLYDYWREPSGAFLVMRWLRGGSLQAALQRGPWHLKAAVKLVQQVASALHIAHRQGVIHRDIKPANILLDEEGNAYLTDFGVATLVGPLAELGGSLPHKGVMASSGSLGYLSPESIRRGTVTAATDIYSLGVVIYELLTAQHPFPDCHGRTLLDKHLHEPFPTAQTLRPELPAAIDEVIQKATAKVPGERHATVLEVVAALQKALIGESEVEITPVDLALMPNPYKGLRPFQEADAADFFGRAELVERLLERLRDERDGRFLALVGPSGSGKSSVVRAGVVPALRQGALPGSEQWFVVQITPGTHPLEELEAALLRIAVNPPQSFLGQMEEEERGFLRAVRRSLPSDDSRLVVVIDQFEELFILVQSESARLHFLNSLLIAVNDPSDQVHVIITLRADYYDRPLRYTHLGELIRQHTELVLPLSPAELTQVITGPAERAGIQLEPGLLAAIISDVGQQPGALPLLQFALTELFEQRQGDRLTQAAFADIGGVSGALARRAEELWTALDSGGREAARQLFSRLVMVSEDGAATRRRVFRSDLESIATLDDNPGSIKSSIISTILESFGRYRLLTFDRDPVTRAPTVELAHEALLQEWQRMREWLDSARAAIHLQQRLSAAAAEWLHADRDTSSLLRGTRLDQFEAWANETNLALTPVEQGLLQASLAERRRRQESEQARQTYEKALEWRAVLRLRALVAVLLVATAVAVLLTLFAFGESRQAQRSEATATVAQGEAVAQAVLAATAASDARAQQAIAEVEAQARATQQAVAEEQAHIATARELSAAALINLHVDPELSMLLALEGVNETFLIDGTVLREAEEALHRALQASRTILTVAPANGAHFNADGRLFITAGPDDNARVFETSSGEQQLLLSGHSARVWRAKFDPAGTRIATTSEDGTAIIWDAVTGKELLTLTGHSDTVYTPAWSPNGKLLVTTSADGTARLWDSETGRELHVLSHAGVTAGPDFSPNGQLVAIADEGASVARVWDVVTGEEVLTLSGHTGGLSEVVFSPDGSRLATAGSDLTARIWDAVNGEELLALTGHNGWVFAVAFSPDGNLLATGSEDGTAKIWDAVIGEELLTLAGHSAGIGSIFFSKDGRRILTGSADGTARVWDITPEGSRDWLTLAGHNALVFNVDYSPDGSLLATASWDGTAKVWDANSGQELLTLSGHNAEVARLLFSPNGQRLATASYDGTVKLWHATSGEELQTLTGHLGPVSGLVYRPGGKQLATSSFDGTAKVWDLDSGTEVLSLEGHEDIVFRVAYSADGLRLATAGWDATARIWDATTGQELLSLDTPAAVNAVAFSRDGTRLVTAGWDAAVSMWDLGKGELIFQLEGHQGIIWDVAYSPDEERLATGSFDGTFKLWDLASRREVLSLDASEEGVADLAFNPKGSRLAVGGNQAHVFMLSIEELVTVARGRLTRSFTLAECRQYLHMETCPAEWESDGEN